jgi:transposase
MAKRFTLRERIDIVKHYYASNNNASVAARLVDQHSPQPSTVIRLVKKFEETGSVKDADRSGRPSLYRNLDFQDAVLHEIDQNTPSSSRRISAQLRANSDYNVSHSTVLKTLAKLGLKPYTPRLCHALNEDDPDRRVEACMMFEEMFIADPTRLDRIIWSDESTFKLNGHINRHNCVYWNFDNQHHIIEKDVHLPGVMVWCAISSRGIIGPYFFDGTVTGVSYLHMLREFLLPILMDYPDDIMFQQDGAPPHYALIVREFLNDNFPERWIGRRGPIEWPARSPDLTPPDFFLWGLLKDKVYSRNPRTIPQLKIAITEEIHSIEVELCEKVCRSVRNRMRLCVDKDGGHFENYS